MKERPILFSAPMVRAILDGTKTQTRWVVKADFMHDPKGSLDAKWYFRGPRAACWDSYETLAELIAQHCPYGQPGDRLWVRETWRTYKSYNDSSPSDLPWTSMFWHEADSPKIKLDALAGKLRPSIHMPRRASRITLEITGVRVERLQDISDHDCLCEGVTVDLGGEVPITSVAGQHQHYLRQGSYALLWESINGRPKLPTNTQSKRYSRVAAWLAKHPNTTGWDANPWVWVVEFERVKP